MGDVADILGFSKPVSNEDPLKFLDEKPKHEVKKRLKKPKGMVCGRYLSYLICSCNLLWILES
jgi:hypothetical protein